MIEFFVKLMVSYGLRNGFVTFYFFKYLEKGGLSLVWILKSFSIIFPRDVDILKNLIEFFCAIEGILFSFGKMIKISSMYLK